MEDLKSFLESLRANVTFTGDGMADVARVQGFRRDKTSEQTAATIAPSGNAFLPGGVKYEQNPFICNELLPTVSASPDGTLRGIYYTFGREGLLNMADEIGMYGEHRMADLGVTENHIDLVEHGGSARISPTERTQFAAVGINIEDEKAAMIKSQVDTRREALGATLLTTEASYASATHYQTLTGTGQWSHQSAAPLLAIAAKVQTLKGILGKKPTHFWVSGGIGTALTLHPSILQYVSGGATKQNPAVPVSLEMIGAILNLRVLEGDVVAATTVGGTPGYVFGDCAGLVYVGGTGMYDLKFGCTLISSGRPLQRVERDPHKGSAGIDVLYYDDAYTHAVQLNTAGYLWSDVTA